MFDVFDIQIPSLSPDAPVEIVQRETAFGLADERVARVGGLRFGRVLQADEAYSNLQACMGSSERANWTVLSVAPAAREAALDDGRWHQFLAALVSVLQAHEAWVVRCESDCDQHSVVRLEISAAGLAMLLDDLRAEHASVAIIATPP